MFWKSAKDAIPGIVLFLLIDKDKAMQVIGFDIHKTVNHCRKDWFIAAAFFLSCISTGALSQETDTIPGDIFEGTDILQIKIRANFDSLFADAAASRIVTRDARIQYDSPDGRVWKNQIKIETRGNFRMRPQNCSFPPLRISFHQNDTLRQLFRKNKTLKLVSQCQYQNSEYEQFLVQEYLIYKLYSLLTNYSFRVRLLKVTYVNQGSAFDTLVRYSFVVESPQEMAKRLGCRRISSINVMLNKVDPGQYKLLCFFQYMVSNNDWSVAISHNIELLQKDSTSSYIPVPYDFDWSGIIKVPYKVPSSRGMEIIQPDRTFKGEYTRRRQVRDMIRYFRSKQGELYGRVSSCVVLDKQHKLLFLNGIREYYKILNNIFYFRQGIIKHKPVVFIEE